jgi:hypothetical protein
MGQPEVTGKRKASPPAAATDEGKSNHAVIVDHETPAVAELERAKRRGWYFLVIRFCLFVTAALVVEVLLAVYQRIDGEDA